MSIMANLCNLFLIWKIPTPIRYRRIVSMEAQGSQIMEKKRMKICVSKAN